MGLEGLAAIPLGLLFLVSGLLTNLLELVLMVTILPFSRNAYRRANAALTNSYWSQLVWLTEWWGCLKLVIFTEPEVWAHFGTESALVISNHRSDVDWIVGWTLAQRSGCLGTTRALMKEVVKYLPVIGWSMWFSEYIFLARDWAKDQAVMKGAFERFRDFPLPFWLALFPEGTRYTEQKLKAAQEFARSQGLPVPRNTLVPRTKGFVMSVEYLREFVPAIYNITVKVPDGVPNPTFGGFFQRTKSSMHVYITRVTMDSLPSDSEGISKWCKDTFLEKDELLEEHKKTNSFDPKLLMPMEPSVWTIVHTAFWSLVSTGILAWAVAHFTGALVFSWETLGIVVLVLVITGGVLHLLIHFTKSEYSTPMAQPKAKPTPVKPKDS